MKRKSKRKIELLIPIREDVDEKAIRASLLAGFDGFFLDRKALKYALVIHRVAMDLKMVPEIIVEMDCRDLDSAGLSELQQAPVTGILLKGLQSEEPLIRLKQQMIEQGLVRLRILASVGNITGVENAILLPPHCDMIVFDRDALLAGDEIRTMDLPLYLQKTARMCAVTGTPLMLRGSVGTDLNDLRTISDLYIAFSFGIRAFEADPKILKKDPYEMLDLVNGYYEMLKQQLIPEI